MSKQELRRSILEVLDRADGGLCTGEELTHLGTTDVIEAEVDYLEGLGLVTAQYMLSDGVAWAKITSKGRDYLDPTGGIGGELSVVTVKLHEDTLRQIFIRRIQAAEADSTVKAKLIDQVKALPAEGLSKLAEKALEEGLRYMPHAVQWLQTAQWS